MPLEKNIDQCECNSIFCPITHIDFNWFHTTRLEQKTSANGVYCCSIPKLLGVQWNVNQIVVNLIHNKLNITPNMYNTATSGSDTL